MDNNVYYFDYSGIEFKVNSKTYTLLRSIISEHLEATKSEETKNLVTSIDLPVQDLKLIKWRISISTMHRLTTITLFKDNTIFNSITYTLYSLEKLLDESFKQKM